MKKTNQNTIAAAFCLLLLVTSVGVYAQSVDSCMTAKGEAAVETCEALLVNGNRSAEVYYQLSSQLYQLGQTSKALSVLNSGLSVHRANKLLMTLRNTLVTDSEEQAALRASARKNEAVMNRGQLKLTCLTKTNSAGLSACQAYLAQTNVDGDRIRARAQIISTALTPAPTTQIVIAPVVPEEQPTSFEPGASTQPPLIEPAPLDQAQIAMRGLIRDIQTELSLLGFDVGIPDGISGPRTRAAVQGFYERTQQIRSDRVDDQTLIDLQAAVTDLNSSKQLLERSRAAASKQDIEQAIDLLASAEKSSVFFTTPSGYQQNLDLQRARRSQNENATLSSTDAVVPPQTVEQTGTATSTTAGNLTAVMSQIESLNAMLTVRRVNGRRQNQAMRDVVDSLFQ